MIEYLIYVWGNIVNMPEAAKWFFAVVSSVVYIIGVSMSVSDTTVTRSDINTWKSTHLFDPGISVYNYRRNAAPGDVWYALWWPLRTGWMIFWTFVGIIHDLMVYPLLLIGFRYKETRVYEKVDHFIDKRWW